MPLSGPLTHMFKVRLGSRLGSRRMVPMLAKPNKEDLVVLQKLLESGEVTAVIDGRHPLSEALWHQEEGHAQGKTAITV